MRILKFGSKANSGFCVASPEVLKHHTATVDTFLKHLNDQQQRARQAKGLNPWPLEQSHVLAALLALRLRGIRLRQSIKNLATTCETVAGPASPEDEFPEKVVYAGHCQGICCSTPTGMRLVNLQTKIVKSLHGMARRYKKTADLVKDDLLIRITIYVGLSSEKIKIVEHYFVTAPAFRGGVQEPIESYIKLAPSGGTFLRLEQTEHVDSDVDWPEPLARAFTLWFIGLLLHDSACGTPCFNQPGK